MAAFGKNKPKGKKSPVTVRGGWFPMPLDFLRSRACAERSPLAIKMLLYLCSQLGPNAKGNGDLSATPSLLKLQGWSSKSSLVAALAELVAAELLCITRRGNRKLCTLYAVTLWPMDCDFSKLDHGPGAYKAEGWRDNPAQSDKPTDDKPATWNRPRKNAIAIPATGEPPADMTPPRGNPRTKKASCPPATGAKAQFPAPRVPPPRDTFLEAPSTPAAVAVH